MQIDAQPLISIITVVYNSEQFIESTLKSVQEQTCKNFQYLIIDGGSKDKTLKIIEQYKDVVDVLVSEPDKGLYDAMNKGLALATGRYIWFINSGDRLFDATTSLMIEQCYQKHLNADIFYGQTQLIDANGNNLGMRKKTAPNPLTANSLKMGLMVCHQSILVKREIAAQYDLSIKVAADYQWVLQALLSAQEIIYTGHILSKYLENGFSANNRLLANKERLKIMLHYYGFFPTLGAHIKIIIRYLMEK